MFARRSKFAKASLISLLILFPLSMTAKEPLLSGFNENYFITGVPLNTAPAYNTSDLTYQISVRFNAFQYLGRRDWNIFWGYTQLSVWDVYKPSNPFRETTYMDGVYACCDRFMTGYEHRSNGRDGYDSRSLDYVFMTYLQPLGRHCFLGATGRFGIGSIGNVYSLEMFNRYQGYANLAFGCRGAEDRIWVKLSVTPLLADIPANVSAEMAFRPVRNADWFYLTAQYHYGYDEAQIDCANPSAFLKSMLRFGVSVQPSSPLHRLFF